LWDAHGQARPATRYVGFKSFSWARNPSHLQRFWNRPTLEEYSSGKKKVSDTVTNGFATNQPKVKAEFEDLRAQVFSRLPIFCDFPPPPALGTGKVGAASGWGGGRRKFHRGRYMRIFRVAPDPFPGNGGSELPLVVSEGHLLPHQVGRRPRAFPRGLH